ADRGHRGQPADHPSGLDLRAWGHPRCRADRPRRTSRARAGGRHGEPVLPDDRILMRVLPSGSAARLVELGSLDEVLAYYSALAEQPPPGVVDILPAARTVMVTIDLSRTELRSLDQALNQVQPRYDARQPGELIEVPVVYDGEDLA